MFTATDNTVAAICATVVVVGVALAMVALIVALIGLRRETRPTNKNSVTGKKPVC